MELRIDADEAGADDEERTLLAGRLRRELLDADVDAVEPVAAGPAPDGSKGVELAAVGALLVSLAPNALTAVVDLVRRWLGNRDGRSVKLTIDGDTIEVTGVSTETQRELIDAWLRRTGGDAPAPDSAATSPGAGGTRPGSTET